MKSKWKITFVIISLILCMFTITMGYLHICKLNETITKQEKELNKTTYYVVNDFYYSEEYGEYILLLENDAVVMADFEIEIVYDTTPTAKDQCLFGIDKDGNFILQFVYATNNDHLVELRNLS